MAETSWDKGKVFQTNTKIMILLANKTLTQLINRCSLSFYFGNYNLLPFNLFQLCLYLLLYSSPVYYTYCCTAVQFTIFTVVLQPILLYLLLYSSPVYYTYCCTAAQFTILIVVLQPSLLYLLLYSSPVYYTYCCIAAQFTILTVVLQPSLLYLLLYCIPV
jgi:hypothetical protein